MLMIDPKMVELSPYMRIPHLMHPVITDMKKAEAVLGWAVDTMEKNATTCSPASASGNLDGYNKIGQSENPRTPRYRSRGRRSRSHPRSYAVHCDHRRRNGDMMMTSGKDVEGHIIRLAQKSARGRHSSRPRHSEADGRCDHGPHQIELAVADRVPGVEPHRQPGVASMKWEPISCSQRRMLYLAPARAT